MPQPRQLAARPTCAVCGTPVERMTEAEEYGALGRRVALTAYCHGSIERHTVPAEWMGNPVAFGLAFAQERRRLS